MAIIGSPRTNGNTYKIVKKVEERFLEKDNSAEFEYVQLGITKIEVCRGCFVCIERGEEYCPLKNNRSSLETKIREADGIIFSTPVYAYNVSWIMKNFIDHFAYCLL